MGEVVNVTFGKTLHPVPGMPKSAPEVFNTLSVLLSDRNKIIKELTFAEKVLFEKQHQVDEWRKSLERVDEKIYVAHQGLMEDFIRESIPGRTV